MDAARAKPNTLTIGTSNAGTSNYLAALLFKSLQKLAVTVVPYRGPANLSVALLRNDVDLVVNAYGGLRPQIEDGKIPSARCNLSLAPGRTSRSADDG
jgi:tripartite-type tricarboxylate transporter receptor subunit TctC